jgi:hypothetical protein
MRDTPEIAAARIAVEVARTKLFATAEELQERLSPKTLARGAWQGAKAKGADIAEDAVDAVRARPLAATGVMAAITLFLARGPLMDLAGKVAHGLSGKREAAKRPKAPGKSGAGKSRTAKKTKHTRKQTETAE